MTWKHHIKLVNCHNASNSIVVTFKKETCLGNPKVNGDLQNK